MQPPDWTFIAALIRPICWNFRFLSPVAVQSQLMVTLDYWWLKNHTEFPNLNIRPEGLSKVVE
jgi:hypothetical protein